MLKRDDPGEPVVSGSWDRRHFVVVGSVKRGACLGVEPTICPAPFILLYRPKGLLQQFTNPVNVPSSHRVPGSHTVGTTHIVR